MRKIFPAAVILAFLGGCSTVAGWFDRDGSSAGVRSSEPVARTTVPSGDGSSVGTPRGDYVAAAPGYNTRTARPYPYAGSIDPATGRVVLNFDEKYWPPVVEGQAFPVQEMWAD